MLKPNVKMVIIILTIIVAISLSLFFIYKNKEKKTEVPIDGLVLEEDFTNLQNFVRGHVEKHPAQEDGLVPIWRAQIDPANNPVGAYDFHPTDIDGNLTSASFNDMRDSFRESNLMLIGNNSTDIHFINGGLLMKGFEDHVKQPLSTAIETNTEYIGLSNTGLRGDVATNANDIRDITKDSDGGKLLELGRRISSNDTDISRNSSNISRNSGNIGGNIQAIGRTRDAFKNALIATRNYYADSDDTVRTSDEFPGGLSNWDDGHWDAQNKAINYLTSQQGW